MARLTNVFRTEETNYNVGRRQIPVVANDNLMMLMDLNSKGLCIDSPTIRGKELEEFTRKYNLLTDAELRESLEIDSATFLSILNQCVQCVGCRRRVERLFNQLALSGHATLDPLVLRSTKILTINEERLKTPQSLGTILYRHHDVLNNLLDSKLRNKTRCLLHSLDAFRAKPFSETWREVWSSMKHTCRNELAVIETKELQEVLENYLKKHKFCQGCRTKIEKAYKILVGENTAKEKGFVASLYANFEKCHRDKHIHVYTNRVDFLDELIRRAEPEVNGSYSKLRERHAKTLEIAQEEVLVCVGMIMYERLRRIYINLREEERACQVLAAVGVHALCRSFDTSVEKKQGISNLELLYQEISRAEKAKEHRREQKKLKKKKKKIEKKNGYRMCESTTSDAAAAAAAAATSTNDDSGSEFELRESRDCEIFNNYEHEAEAEEELDDDDDDDDDEDDIDEAFDVSEESVADVGDNRRNAQKRLKNKAATTVARPESNSDATEEDEEEAENELENGNEENKCENLAGNVNILAKNENENQQNTAAVPCQGLVVISKKKKRSKQKKLKVKNNKVKSSAATTATAAVLMPPPPPSSTLTTGKVCGSGGPAVPIRPLAAIKNLNVVVNTSNNNNNKCSDCLAPTHSCPCDVKDSGYGSEPNFSHENSRVGSELSSPEGSEISCSDGFCNHEHVHEHILAAAQRSSSSSGKFNIGLIETAADKKLNSLLAAQRCDNENCDSVLCQQRYMTHFSSLQQMLDDDDCCAGDDGDENDAENYIPQEVVFKFQCQREQVEQKRQKLRENLRQNFAKLCNKLASAGTEVIAASKITCNDHIDCK